MELGRNQYVVSLKLGIFQGRPKSYRPNSETVKIRPMAQEADSTHFFRPISVHPSKKWTEWRAGTRYRGPQARWKGDTSEIVNIFVAFLSQNIKKLKGGKFLFSEKNLIVPKKTERRDPLGFSNIHSVAKQQKKLKGGPFEEKNSRKKSRSAEKKWKWGNKSKDLAGTKIAKRS